MAKPAAAPAAAANDNDDNTLVPPKEHYFELSLRSVSHGVLNQECPIVREYAFNAAQLTAKQMMFAKEVMIPVSEACLAAMDKMSKPVQDVGNQQMIDMFEEFMKE
jgi:hypothetical protein